MANKIIQLKDGNDNCYPITGENFHDSYTYIAQNTLAYTGVSVIIPPHCEYCIHLENLFVNTAPLEIAISSSPDSAAEYLLCARANAGSTSICGYNYSNSNAPFYVWTRNAGSGAQNMIITSGVIRHMGGGN